MTETTVNSPSAVSKVLPATQVKQMCIACPWWLKFDEAAAIKFILLFFDKLRAEGHIMVNYAFFAKNHPGPDERAVWQSLCSPGETPIEIDTMGEKYSALWRSKTQRQAFATGLRLSQRSLELEALVNENNERGILKVADYSVADLLRKVPHVLPDNVQSQREVLHKALDVIDCWYRPAASRDWAELFEGYDQKCEHETAVPGAICARHECETKRGPHGKMRALWNSFDMDGCDLVPFTLPWYFYKLFCSTPRSVGHDTARDSLAVRQAIYHKVAWWLLQDKAIKQQQELADTRQYRVRDFFLSDGRKCGLVHLQSYFEEKAIFRQYQYNGEYALMWIRMERQGMTPLTILKSSGRAGTPDLEPLIRVFRSREPEVWYSGAPYMTPMLMQGSWQYHKSAETAFIDEQLVDATKQYVRYPPDLQRRRRGGLDKRSDMLKKHIITLPKIGRGEYGRRKAALALAEPSSS